MTLEQPIYRPMISNGFTPTPAGDLLRSVLGYLQDVGLQMIHWGKTDDDVANKLSLKYFSSFSA